jgi:hypothetical protein
VGPRADFVVGLIRAIRRLEIRSGGQSGVDRAALDVALKLDLPYSGWCPRGGWAEDRPTAPGIVGAYPKLQTTPSADPRQRTAWNVRDSDATLLLVRGKLWDSPGATFTRACAELVFERPFHSQDLQAADASARTMQWVESLREPGNRGALVLNVAGPRESESPGIYEVASAFLGKLLRAFVKP